MTGTTELADVIVVGMGPGSEHLAGRLAEAGLDVVAVESGLVGGECPYWGCIPSKMMIRAANLLAEGRRIPGMAGTSVVVPDWAPVAGRVREATDGWDDRVAAERFEAKGGRLVRGEGRLVGPNRVAVGDRRIEARRGVVLSTGSQSTVPPIPGLAGTPYWTNRQAIEAAELPGSLLVVGGGAIGLELGQAFARFGATVTILEGASRLLPAEDPEAAQLIEGVLASEGLEIRTGARVDAVRHDGEAFTLTLAGGETHRGEKLLVAAGRRPDLTKLGVEVLGIDPGAPALAVDDRMRVAPGVWAVGDVTGIGPFTHVSMYQARIAAADILGEDSAPADYRALPRVTFTDPEVGSVGLDEAAARDRGLRVRTGRARVPESTRGWIHNVGNEGLIKLVEDVDEGVLVGALSVGPTGGEVLGLLTLAVHARVPTTQLRHMIYAYPTFHRAIGAALEDLAA